MNYKLGNSITVYPNDSMLFLVSVSSSSIPKGSIAPGILCLLCCVWISGSQRELTIFCIAKKVEWNKVGCSFCLGQEELLREGSLLTNL